jgi:hypothetical protein
VGAAQQASLARRARALIGVLVAIALVAGRPSFAAEDACPAATPTYTGNCGPTFVLPAWGDAG